MYCCRLIVPDGVSVRDECVDASDPILDLGKFKERMSRTVEWSLRSTTHAGCWSSEDEPDNRTAGGMHLEDLGCGPDTVTTDCSGLARALDGTGMDSAGPCNLRLPEFRWASNLPPRALECHIHPILMLTAARERSARSSDWELETGGH